MKIKLDENIPVELRDELIVQGHSVDTVPEEGLRGRSDADIWQVAQMDERFLITQDLDFSDRRRYRPGTHAGILLVRLRVPTRSRLVDRVGVAVNAADLREWQGCLVVLSDTRVRIQRPSTH